MTKNEEIVCLVDDDERVRAALSELLASLKITHAVFGSAAQYLARGDNEDCACLILDLHLPDSNGLDLQRQLGDRSGPPIIFISGRGDIPASVRAMKAGAIEFLTKPIDTAALVAAIQTAFGMDRERRRRAGDRRELNRRFALSNATGADGFLADRRGHA